jgi:hypothetical protein
MNLSYLQAVLAELLFRLSTVQLPLIVGGGFGIYLRRRSIEQSRERTLLNVLPEARSTHDIDLFLRPELFVDSVRLVALKEALQEMGFKPVETAKFYQFVRADESGRFPVKIDLLTASERNFKPLNIKTDDRRVHPNPPISLHAHPCNEAFTLTQALSSVRIEGELDGKTVGGEVFLPHPYTYLCMKLVALADQIENGPKDCGRHHALDIYSIIGTILPSEWEQCLEFKKRYASDEIVKQCSEIVASLFSSEEAKGVLRLRENYYFRNDFQLVEFIAALNELFSATGLAKS